MQKRALKVIAGAEVPVIAAYSDNTKTLTLANYQCQECNTSVVSNRVVTPSCPVCAGTLEETTDKALVLSRAEVDDLAYLGHCEHCDTHINSSIEIVAKLTGSKIHCPVCAAPVDVEELPAEVEDESTDDMEDDEEINASDMSEDEMSEDEESEDEGDEGSEDDMSEDMPEDEMSEDMSDDEFGDEGSEDDMSEDMPEDEGSEDEGSEISLEDEEDPDASPVPGDELDEGMSDEEMSDDLEEDPVADMGEEDDDLTAEASLIDYIKESSQYELIMAGTDPNNRRYFLFVDDVPVAIASKANATESIAKLFGTEKFAKAFNVVASEDLTEESIKDFGFEPIKVTVPVDQVAQQQTKDLLAKKDGEVQAALKDISDKFIQAVGIAAVGYNKGVFSSDEAGIREYLVSELTKNRMRNAAKLVDTAFERHGEAYLRTIIAKATDLSRKSPDTIAEVAEMVATASYRASAVTATVEEETTNTARIVPFSTTAAHHENEVVADTDEDSFEAALSRVTARLGERRT